MAIKVHDLKGIETEVRFTTRDGRVLTSTMAIDPMLLQMRHVDEREAIFAQADAAVREALLELANTEPLELT